MGMRLRVGCRMNPVGREAPLKRAVWKIALRGDHGLKPVAKDGMPAEGRQKGLATRCWGAD
jgi:hypothetical protein